MGEKETILNKLTMKDYRGDLEFILENKKFDEEAKNLLLNVYYKLESFYKDYQAIKIECEDKNNYLEDYVKIIKAKCNKILIVKPNEISDNKHFYINKKTGEIKVIPNELFMLQAVFSMIERDVSTDRFLLEDFTKICLNETLYKAKTINSIEPLRDFTGWSWQVSLTDNDSIINNLIYQNIILLLGYKFINQNIYKTDIIGLVNNELNKKKYGEYGYNFLMNLLKTCIIIFNNSSLENHDKCLKYKKSLISKNKMLSVRKEYIEDKNKDSSSISKEIKEIDNMFEDIDLLREQYRKEIKKDKKLFMGLSDFVEKLESDKAKLLGQIKENNRVLKQKQYLFSHEDYENKLKLYDEIDEKKENVNLQNQLIKLQKDFLECLKIKIENASNKKDLCDIIVELRYYYNLLVKKNKTIIEVTDFSQDFENIEKLIIYKMVENKFIDLGFKDKEFNYNILKYIFKTKMLDLKESVIKIMFVQDNKINVEYYDGKMIENKASFEIPEDDISLNKKDKKDKKIRLFKIGG